MKQIAKNELVQVMRDGQPGEIALGPDGNLYQWVKGVNKPGNPHGSWQKLRRLELCALTYPAVNQAIPTVTRVAAQQSGFQEGVRGSSSGSYWHPIRLQKAAVIGNDGLGALYQAVDGTIYEVVGLEDESQKGFEYPDFHVVEEMKLFTDELSIEVKNWADRLNSIGDDAQLANVDLQNVLQKQQQTLQMMSTISKMINDTAMAIIRKIGG